MWDRLFGMLADGFVSMYEWAIYVLFTATLFESGWKRFRWKYAIFSFIPVYMELCTYLGLPSLCRICGVFLLSIWITFSFFQKALLEVVFVNIIWCMVAFVCDFLVMGIFYLMNSQNGLDLLLGDKLVWFQGAYLSKSFSFFFVMLFCKLLKKGRHAYNKKELAVAMLQGATSMFCLLVICYISLYVKHLPQVNPYMLCAASFVIMLTFVLTFEIYERYLERLNRDKEMQMIRHDMQEKQVYYKSMEEMQGEVRKLNHDMKNHLSVLAGLEEKDGKKAKEYADKLMEQMKNAAEYYDTGNSIVDIILNEKSRAAENKNVELEAVIEKNCLNGYQSTYLCAIFANALDNAVEAAAKVKKGRNVRVKAFRAMDEVIIDIKNPYRKIVLDSEGTLLTTKRKGKNHGIGMSSLQNAVKHLGGDCLVQVQEQFSITIRLPLNENLSTYFDKKQEKHTSRA